MAATVIQLTEEQTKEIIKRLDDFFFTESGEFILHTYDEVMRKASALEIRTYMHHKAFYTIPTKEMIEFIRAEIGDKSCIEIASGNGLYGKVLGVRMTDNYQQALNSNVRMFYLLSQQPLIEYAPDVETIDALDAVIKYKPQVIFGSYVTPRGSYTNDSLNGYNCQEDGPREIEMMQQESVTKYIKVGSLKTHRKNRLYERPDISLRIIQDIPLITRAIYPENTNDSAIFIAEKK